MKTIKIKQKQNTGVCVVKMNSTSVTLDTLGSVPITGPRRNLNKKDFNKVKKTQLPFKQKK